MEKITERSGVAAPRCAVCGGPGPDGSGCEHCPAVSHVSALTYSRLERLHFWFFKTWPRSVVTRRLDAWDADERALRELMREAGVQP